MLKLVLRYSSNKPVKAKPKPTGLPAFRAKLNEKKSVKRMVLEKRKSDVLLDKGGTMFKVQAQFSGKISYFDSISILRKNSVLIE